MTGTDKQIIAALKMQRNQYADDCAELKAAYDMAMLRVAELQRELFVIRLKGSDPSEHGHPVPEDGGFWTPPSNDEHGPAQP